MGSGGFHVSGKGFEFANTGYSRVGTDRHPERWNGVVTPPKRVIVQPGPQPMIRQRDEYQRISDQTMRDAMIASAAPRVPWDEFLPKFRTEFMRGEHVGLVGPTGQGKTTFIFNIYPLHPFTAVFGTKPRDESMDAFVNSGFLRLEHWRSLDPRQFPRRVIWPQPRTIREMIPYQRAVFEDAMEKIYAEGHWDLIIDEGFYIDEVLKLGPHLRLFYTQVRALGISIILATQRPAWVPVEVYDQSTHLFFWRDNDARNLRRLQEISLIHSEAIREIVPNLEKHQVLYLNTRTGEMCRTRSPKIELPLGR